MENKETDFSKLWKSQTVESTNINQIKSKIMDYKRTSIKKRIIANSCLILTFAFIIGIWFLFKPVYMSTNIGISLIIFAIGLFLFKFNQLYRIFESIHEDQTIQDYLNTLLRIQIKQKYMQRNIMTLYFVFLTVGICLYMYEYAVIMSTTMAITVYSITLIWLIFNWVYLRPKMIKKQDEKLNQQILSIKNTIEGFQMT